MNVILLENVRQLGEDQDQTIKLQAKYNPVECRGKKKNKYNPVECRARKRKNIFARLVPCINHTSALSLKTKQNTHQHPKPNNKTQEVNR
jgi:hypothetical protein